MIFTIVMAIIREALRKMCIRDRSQGVLVVEAMEKSGTMHTAEYAKKQNRRLACYYHGLLKYSTGNNVLENLYQAAVIKTNEDLENYLCEIADIEEMCIRDRIRLLKRSPFSKMNFRL